MTQENGGVSAEFRSSALLTSSGFRHAFFTRRGGVSTGPYASLSFSASAGDAMENVDRNLERAASALGVALGNVYFLSQVHGRNVHVLAGTESFSDVVALEGDALVSRNPRCAVGVRAADCVPILIGDRRSGAAVAIHAGWKGLVAGVIRAGLERLAHVAGAPTDPVAAIGPHITVNAFEVSEDVAATLAACAPNVDVVDRRFGAKPHVSLSLVARAELVSMGLSENSIDEIPGCTFREPEDFFSFRRDGGRSGRHLAAIVPRLAGRVPTNTPA